MGHFPNISEYSNVGIIWNMFVGFSDFPFYNFDRYEIQIQDLGDSISQVFIISGACLHKI